MSIVVKVSNCIIYFKMFSSVNKYNPSIFEFLLCLNERSRLRQEFFNFSLTNDFNFSMLNKNPQISLYNLNYSKLC